MFRKHAWLVLLTCSLCPASVSAQIVTPNRVFGRYQAFNWQEQHGVPQSTVLTVATTRDGYIWLGTYEGAARFDGLRFTLFSPTNTEAIGSPMVMALLQDRAGDLWLGTYGGGLTRLSAGRFTRYTARDGLASDYVTRVFEDRNGTLWIGTDGGGVSRWRDGRFTSYGVADGLPGDLIRAIAEDAEGGIWIGTNRGIARMSGVRFSAGDLPAALASTDTAALFVARDRALWIGATDGRLYRFADHHLETFGPAQGLHASRIESFLEDREGRLWIGTAGAGIVRFTAGRLELGSSADGLAVDRVVAVAQGTGNDMWLGTDAGLVRLTDPRVRVYTQRDGLSDDRIGSIYQDDAGDVWIGTRAGLNRFQNGVFRALTTKDGLLDSRVRRMARSTHRGLWVTTLSGLVHVQGRRVVSADLPEGVEPSHISTILQDRSDDLWIGVADDGVMRVRNGQATHLTRRDGLADNAVVTLFEDRAGDVWIGTRGGMTRVRGDQLTSWTTRDGLANDHAKSFYEEQDGTLWVGTHGGGLSRFKHGRFATVSMREGLYNDIVFTILDDDDGNLWMSCNKGIWRANLRELNEVADGRRAAVTSFAYGLADGMLSSEGVGSNFPGWRMRDGTLWFATVRGVAVVDPHARGTEPPRVVLESAMVDREPHRLDRVLRIEPAQEAVEIHYTGLSWNRPHEMRFRYRLSGLDREWVDAGTRRTAYYSHLPAGDYTFEVTADNGEGVWSAQPQRLALSVLPPFYRTWWFESLLVLAAVSATAVVWRFRVVALTRAHATQQAFARELIASQEQERKRIAAELHDGLGQRLVVIHNLAMMCAQAPAGGNNGSSHRLDTIVSQSHGAIDEIRDISYNLRPYHLDTLGLTKALASIVRTTGSAAPTLALTHDIDDVDGAIPGDAAINVYRIVQESLNNIVKHSGAHAASVTVRREPTRLILTIRDDGAGFGPDAKRRDGRRGGFGLVGIRERALLLGGNAAVHSIPGQGTTVTVDIPLH
jgi:signal transduction histidine kinase/ligand-binding sensor domain-containing protein